MCSFHQHFFWLSREDFSELCVHCVEHFTVWHFMYAKGNYVEFVFVFYEKAHNCPVLKQLRQAL